MIPGGEFQRISELPGGKIVGEPQLKFAHIMKNKTISTADRDSAQAPA
jgi:hypothetical protein